MESNPLVNILAAVVHGLSDPVGLRLVEVVAPESEVCSYNLEGPLAKSEPSSPITFGSCLKTASSPARRGKWTRCRVAQSSLERVWGVADHLRISGPRLTR